MENQIGKKLFVRDNKTVTLTDNGRILKYYVDKAFHHLLTAQNMLEEENNHLAGEIRIGIHSHVGVFLLPSIIDKFTKQYPEIKFTIYSSTTDDMLTKYKNRELDLLILHYPIFHDNNNHEKVIFQCESCFFATKNFYDLFMHNEQKEIMEYPLLLPMRGFITSNQLEKLFKDDGVILTSKIYLYTTEMILALAKQGLGIGWGLKKSVEQELLSKQLYEIPLNIQLPVITFSLGYNEKYITDSVHYFIDFIVEESKKLHY